MPKVSEGRFYKKKYTEEDIINAIQAVRNGMPKKTAATKFGVPRPTLQFRLSSQYVKSRPGPTTILTEDEEKILVEWIITCSRKGFPRRKEDILLSVEQFLTINPRPNCFINNKPGEGWYRLFLKRHPDITARTAEAVTAASANVSESNIRLWFRQIEQYLKENDLFDVLLDASRVFNGDETNFQLCPKNTRVLAEKGCKNVYEVDHAQAKSCLTVMFTFSACGDTTPPMVIYPLKRMRADIRTSVPSHWGLGLSDNGWVNKDLFFQYINNVLYPYLLEKKTRFPIILFVDGHKSHINYELSESCKEKGIILIALYPNSTRILQPADVSAFKPMKNAWKRSVLDWRRKNLTKTLTKVDFGPILTMALEKYMNQSSIINGFKTCGLYPWNPNEIDFSKCLGKPSSSVSNLQSNSEQLKPTMALETFQIIVGPSILKNLQPHSVIKNPFQDALTKVFNFFKSRSITDDIHVEHTNINAPLLDNIPILTHASGDLGNAEDFETVTNPIQNINIDTPVFFELSDTADSNLMQNISSNDNIFENLSDIKLIDTYGSVSNEIETDDIDCQTVSPFPHCSTSLPISNNVTELTPEKINLKTSLLWPKTPVRKGRQIENKPVFVLTSNKWLELEKSKIDEKQKKEDEKQERKRQREEKKTKNKASANIKMKKVQQNTNEISIANPKANSESDENLPLSSFKRSTKVSRETVLKDISIEPTTLKDAESYADNSLFQDNIVLNDCKPLKQTITPKIKVESQIQLAKPKHKASETSANIITHRNYAHTVIKAKDFILPRPLKKVLQRRDTFCNEKELADFLENDDDDSNSS